MSLCLFKMCIPSLTFFLRPQITFYLLSTCTFAIFRKRNEEESPRNKWQVLWTKRCFSVVILRAHLHHIYGGLHYLPTSLVRLWMTNANSSWARSKRCLRHEHLEPTLNIWITMLNRKKLWKSHWKRKDNGLIARGQYNSIFDRLIVKIVYMLPWLSFAYARERMAKISETLQEMNSNLDASFVTQLKWKPIPALVSPMCMIHHSL